MTARPRPLFSIDRAARGFFFAGMALLGFSTAAGEGSAVVSFGLPFLAVAAALYVAVRLRTTAVDRTVVPHAIAGLCLASALVLATAIAPVPRESVARLIPNLLGFVLFGFVLSPFYAPRAEDRYRSLSWVLVLTGGIIGTYFVTRFVLAVAKIGLGAVLVDRVTGGVYSLPWGATNVVASTLILPVFLTFYLANPAAVPSARARALVVVLRLVMMGAVFAAVSRGANVSMIVGMVALLAVLRGRPRRQLLLFFGAFGVVLAGIDAWTGGAITSAATSGFFSRFQAADVGNLNGRTDIWQHFLGAFANSPLVGVGYFASLRMFGTTGHDLVLTTLVERGILGAALSVLVVLSAAGYWYAGLRRAQTAERRLFLGALGVGGACSMLHLMFEDANFTQQYMIMSWIALALPFLAWRADLQPRSLPASAPRQSS
jgi:O-antigen ligase